MPNKFSKLSLSRLETCHPDLQRLAHAVLERIDITVLCGHRNKADQNAAYARGASKLKWPKGKHNKVPSLAMDIAPYPLDWKDLKRFKDLSVIVLEEAKNLNIPIRWGGDWDGDGQTSDERFVDMPHYELK